MKRRTQEEKDVAIAESLAAASKPLKLFQPVVLHVQFRLIEEALGPSNANAAVLRDHLVKKRDESKLHEKAITDERIEEEIAALPTVDEQEEKATTVFPRDEDGRPMWWNYQLKGQLKGACLALMDLIEGPLPTMGLTKLSRFNIKGIVDNYIHVSPRRLRMSNPVGDALCVRPLRVTPMMGPERVCLASSEVIPAGTAWSATITIQHPALYQLIRCALDRGALCGMGQWRSSGKGGFNWEIIEVDSSAALEVAQQ